MKYVLRLILALNLLYGGFSSAQILNPIVVDIPMRDGKTLKADVYLPNTTDTFPTILIQTPYSRVLYRLNLPLGIGKQLSSSPYAFVIVDWRCFYGSAAACISSPKRGEDGYDVVEWINAQPWSDGKIGTWGPSALGIIQYQTARENPPSLDCIAPLVAGSQNKYLQIFPGGAAITEHIEQLDGLGFGLSSLYYSNPVKNLLWQIAESETMYPADIKVPTFMIGGWYDHNVQLMTELYEALQTSSDISVRNQHRLLMGPWAHGGFGTAYVGSGQQGELFYPEAAGWSDSLAVVFFDYHLRNLPNGWDNTPKVQYFQMGQNTWESAAAWPPDGTFEQKLFLHETGEIQSFLPTTTLGQQTFAYDPNDPSPTHGGPTLRADQLQGPYDQSDTVESRNDILLFSSPTLTQPVIVKGKPYVDLYVSSDRLDTDFAIRLTDVYPDGRSMLLSDDIQRMRFRNGYAASDTSAMIPGEVYPIKLTLPDIAHTFLPGHKIRLDVSSSNYPRFNRNMNTGGPMYPGLNGDTLVNPLIATNTVYMNSLRPSSITLPLTDSLSTGIDFSQTDFLAFEIYPNPTRETVVIYLTEKVERIRLTDLSGKVWAEDLMPDFVAGEYLFSVEKCPEGLYLLEVISPKGRGWKKLMVRRD
ncbi:MAG: CocE/NonD family hydrolase [Bacteroidia bacterium]|nr:CocE/NonD family hydrolase [Bacteroidia bacterium]